MMKYTKLPFGRFLIVNIFFLLLVSCEKETTSSVTYLNEGEIKFKASGEHPSGHSYSYEDTYSFYEKYENSRMELMEDGSIYVIFTRFSEDFQSYINFVLRFDESGNHLEESLVPEIGFNFIILDEDTYHHISTPYIVGYHTPPYTEIEHGHSFEKLDFDPKTGKITGEFTFYYSDYIDLSGSFDIQAQEIIH